MTKHLALPIVVEASELRMGQARPYAKKGSIVAVLPNGAEVIYATEDFCRVFIPLKRPEGMSIEELRAVLPSDDGGTVSAADARISHYRDRVVRAMRRQGRRYCRITGVEPWLSDSADMSGYRVTIQTDRHMDLMDARRMWDTTHHRQVDSE